MRDLTNNSFIVSAVLKSYDLPESGDVSVPTNFRVMGYMAPYYYSYIIPNMDEEDNSLMLYRFRL